MKYTQVLSCLCMPLLRFPSCMFTWRESTCSSDMTCNQNEINMPYRANIQSRLKSCLGEVQTKAPPSAAPGQSPCTAHTHAASEAKTSIDKPTKINGRMCPASEGGDEDLHNRLLWLRCQSGVSPLQIQSRRQYGPSNWAAPPSEHHQAVTEGLQVPSCHQECAQGALKRCILSLPSESISDTRGLQAK